MKKYKVIYIGLFALGFMGSCKQEVIDLQAPIDSTVVVTPVKGNLDFTKFVAVGSSYTAGFQAGALFNAGQDNSLAAILNRQFESVGAPADFKQPTIKSEFGYNIFVTPNPIPATNPPVVLGRFLLQYNGADSPRPTPQLSGIDAIPNPGANPAFIYGDGTTKAALNNFSVQAIVLGQALIPQTGDWSVAGVDPRFNPFYGRLAYPGNGASTIIGDVAVSGGSFLFFWLGMDDFMLYAAFGGDPTKAPLTNAVGGTQADFDFQYAAAVGTLLGSNSALKGVVANYPDIFAMPHFTSVPWNAIEFTTEDQATAIDPTNSAYAPYNGGLDAAFSGGAISATERDQRKIQFDVGANGIVIEDESLTDLSGFGLPSIRQATADDILPLSAGSVLGTEATPGNPSTTWGVGKALTDQYVLIPDEINEINLARTSYNTIISGFVAAHADKLALADMESAMNQLVLHTAAVYNGVTITPKIDPPAGIYSEDGIHPNTRGYAFLSNVVIGAINAKTEWGATIPKTDISKYGATALPIP